LEEGVVGGATRSLIIFRQRGDAETEHGLLDNLAAPTSMTTKRFAAALAKDIASK
jgi:hypothetical protein